MFHVPQTSLLGCPRALIVFTGTNKEVMNTMEFCKIWGTNLNLDRSEPAVLPTDLYGQNFDKSPLTAQAKFVEFNRFASYRLLPLP